MLEKGSTLIKLISKQSLTTKQRRCVGTTETVLAVAQVEAWQPDLEGGGEDGDK